MGFITDLARSNFRLIALGLATGAGFIVSQFWRDAVDKEIRAIDVVVGEIYRMEQAIAEASGNLNTVMTVLLTDSAFAIGEKRARLVETPETDETFAVFTEAYNARVDAANRTILQFMEYQYLTGLAFKRVQTALINRAVRVSNIAVPDGLVDTRSLYDSFRFECAAKLDVPGGRDYIAFTNALADDLAASKVATGRDLVLLAGRMMEATARFNEQVGERYRDVIRETAVDAQPPPQKSPDGATAFKRAAIENLAILGPVSACLSGAAGYVGSAVPLYMGWLREAIESRLVELNRRSDNINYLSYAIAVLGFVAGNLKASRARAPRPEGGDGGTTS